MTEGSGRDGTGPPIRLFTYAPSRSTKTALELYAGFRQDAVLMTECCKVYVTVADAHGLVHLGCWTHCRRYSSKRCRHCPRTSAGRINWPHASSR